MSKTTGIRLAPTTQQWLSNSTLEVGADAVIDHLIDCGYAPATVNSYLSCIAHFAHWCTCGGIEGRLIDEHVVSRFLDKHLAHCRCAARCRRAKSEIRAALSHLLAVLRDHGLIARKACCVSGAIAEELQLFGIYLTQVRGLRIVTRDTRLHHVRDFLRSRFGGAAIEIENAEPADIRRFMMSYTANWKPASVRSAGNSLRSYLRYKAVLGTQTTALIAAIPSVAQWRLAPLPKALSTSEVKRLLAAFDRHTVGGRRDYAIARCYVDLGLRTSEIVRLKLDDFDWRAGVVQIRGKGQRTDAMPLPKSTGRAIVAYLRNGRRKAADRTLFLRIHPPLERSVSPTTIRGAVRNAARRCGLDTRLTGPHVLRHTLATRLVRNGVSIKEIADVLRHRSLDTTTIYAKVDLDALSTVAMPWPEGKA